MKGKVVYDRGPKAKPRYTTYDKGGHNGETWNGADTIVDLKSRNTRNGTYDSEMNRIGD